MEFFNKLINFFREEKSDIRDLDFTSESDSARFLLGVSDGQPLQVQPRTAYYLNEKNSDLGTATGRISSAVGSLKKGLRNNDGEIIFDHPLLSLLRNPGGGLNTVQFWREITESFLLTQEIPLVARGNINREPLSIDFIRPFDISIVMNENDGIPDQILTQSRKDRRTYKRFEKGRDIRFVDDTGLNEIFFIRGAISLVDDWSGRSPLVKLFYDIAMNTDGKRHNVSLLKNGMRTTGVLSPAPSSKEGVVSKWTKPVVDTIQSRLRAFHQGSGNAGNTLILGSPAKFEGLSQSNRDMDFLNLLKNSQVSIYNLYEIPLPLVLPETMTLDNYTAANRTYYTKAVFPVYDNIGAGMIQTLGKRFDLDPDEVAMGFSEVAIRDMQPILVENMEKLKKTEAVSVNEVRKVGGLEDTDDGDVILVSSNKVPLSSVAVPLDFPDTVDDDLDDDLDNDIDDDLDDDDSDGDDGI